MFQTLLVAAQAVTLALAATDPPSPAVLHNNERAYVRVHYESDAPVRIFVTPYFHGAVARGPRMSGSPLYNAGAGDALSSFDFGRAAEVDALRIEAGDGRTAIATLTAPVSLVWDGQLGPPRQAADWVARLQTAALQLQWADQKRAAESRLGSGAFGAVGEMLYVSIVVAAAFGVLAAGLVWPIWGVVRWRGGWRVAASVPLAAALLWAAKDAYDVSLDSTSHNLLPFEFLIGAAVAAPYMIVVGVAKRLRGR